MMKGQGVTYAAAIAAAVTLAALGYAVVWGVDPADLGRPAEIAKPGTDVPIAQDAPVSRPRPADAVLTPAPGVPPDEAGRLAPVRQVIAAPKGADGRSLPASVPHVASRAVAVSPRLKPRPQPDPLRPPLSATLPQDAPAALSESVPLSAVDPPAEPDRAEDPSPPPTVLPPPAAPRAVVRPAPRLALPQPAPAPVLPRRRALGEFELEPPPGVTITRGAPDGPSRSAARLATGERAVEPPPGITITQGAPQPSAPGPLIIRVPDRRR